MFDSRTGEILIDILRSHDVERIYGMPGNSINEFIDDLRKREDDIDFIQVRHEEVGALAAASQAKLTGKIGVCLSIAGPGAIHLLNGLYDAQKDKVPVLAIVGQVFSTQLKTDVQQEINLERLFDGVGMYHARAEKAEQLPFMMQEAIKQAYTHQTPSVLIVPDDLFAVKHKEKNVAVNTKLPIPRIMPHEEEMQAAIQKLNQAKKPAILAGRGTYGAREELIQFAEKIQAPIIVSLLGKGTIPDQHPLNLGQHGQIGTKPAYHAIMETDLLLLIGTSFPYREYLPKNAEAIQIDIDRDNIGKLYPLSVGLCGDTKEILPYLTNHIEENTNTAFLQKYQKKMEQWQAHLQTEINKTDGPLHGPQVIDAVQQQATDDAIVSLDVGNVTVWTTRFFQFMNQHLLNSGALATMGSGLPGAIAAQLEKPEKQVIAICGDGGFSMVMQDFITAVRYDLPIKVIILNNQMIGMIKYEQQEAGNLNYETNLENADYAAFAKACGGDGFRVEKQEELYNTMEQAFASNKPTVIDVGIEDLAPLPGQITYDEAVKYSEHVIKEFFENKNVDFPDIGKVLKRL